MGRPVNSNVPEDGYKSKRQFEETGSIAASDFAVVDDTVNSKKIAFQASAITAGKTITVAAGTTAADITLTLPAISGTFALTSQASSAKTAYIQDQKASSTGGGASTAGSWLTRDLNTVVDPEGTGITVSSNQMIIPAGSYHVSIKVPFHGINNRANSRLYNITDTALILNGSSVCETSGDCTYQSHIEGYFTLAAQKTVEVQYRVQTLQGATSALGFPSGASFAVGMEIYTQVKITKV